jgi:hypothetical protein
MKLQLVITIITLLMTTTVTYSLLWVSFSLALSNNIAEASTPTNNNSFPFLSGIISSLVLDIPLPSNEVSNDNNLSPFNITNIQKFILAGEWNMRFDNITSTPNSSELQIVGFEADFMGITTEGKGPHTHQISNFRPVTIDSSKFITEENKTSNHFNLLSPDGNASILGIVDVGVNGQKIWENVTANITIFEGKTIEILLNDKDVDYHFGKGQAIYGLVTRLNLG